MKNNNPLKSKLNNPLFRRIICFIILILLWQLVALIVNESLLFPSPVSVLKRFFQLFTEKSFYETLLYSFPRLLLGFLLGMTAAVLLALPAYKSRWAENLISPLIVMMKTVPVASFIILALIWLNSASLSVFISAIMSLPIVYTNLLEGLKSVPDKMLSLSSLYKLSFLKKLRFIYFPHLKPFLLSALSLSLGISVKSGIAAELIGLPSSSIGETLYNAKVYFATGDLFAWTIHIVLITLIIEKLFTLLLKTLYRLSEARH